MVPICFFIILLVCSSKSLPLNDFFPYGSESGDITIGANLNESELHFELPYMLPYFDNNYRQIWITNNGLISFQSAMNYNYYDPFNSPNNDSLIAVFWHMNIWNVFNETVNEVYCQIHNTTSSSNSSLIVFNKAKNNVRSFFPQERPFEPTMVIIGTWYYLGVYGNGNNTFQTVLSTDGDRTFVFFLYHDLQWSTSYNDSSYYYAQAGFHVADRNISETLPDSGTEDIVQLVNKSNVNVPGLFAFRIDTETINGGGCNQNLSTVSFRPRISSQLGSGALTIYGPCFTSETKIVCRFGSSENIIGHVLDQFRAICLTPFGSTQGRVPMSVSIDNGQTFTSVGTFTYAPLQFGSDEVTIEIEGNDNLLNPGQLVNLTCHFSEIIKNTFPDGTKVDIELWKVSLNQGSQLQKDNTPIILGQNLDLNNFVRVQLPSTFSDISTCFIRVVARFNSTTYAGLNTGLLVIRNPSPLASELCQNWATQQTEPSTWNNAGLLPCPMTHWQVLSAGHCCYDPDRQCIKGNSNPKNCWLHQGRVGRNESSAVECYVSKYSNSNGAGAECCYDNNEMLITRGTGAGTDDRYQSSISPIQHFFHDTLPYLQCCIMTTNTESCNKYMHYRPPRRGSNTMGESGRMWGDPHFGTLDGSSYTFNGYGEYIYLFITNESSPSPIFNSDTKSYIFTSQIRTVPLSSGNATVTKGFAARSNDPKAESVSLTISQREHIILHYGNEILEFEDNINTFFFPELTITRLEVNNNNLFSFSWTIGITIEVSVIKMISPSEQLVLNVAASIAGIYRGKTYGLLGTYDGIQNNDLRNKNGTIVNSNASLEQIHNNFGVTWAIDPSTSLFYYQSDQSAQFFQERNRDFIPSFVDPTEINSSIITSCNIDATSLSSSWNPAQRACYYDLFITNDKAFAQSSLKAGNEYLLIKTNQRSPPLFDPSLPLNKDLKLGEFVHLNISASSEDPSSIILISVLHLPQNSIFNQSTGIFTWTAILGEHYLTVQAFDKTYNLKSQHDITFNVKATVGADGNRLNGGSFLVVMIILLCQ